MQVRVRIGSGVNRSAWQREREQRSSTQPATHVRVVVVLFIVVRGRRRKTINLLHLHASHRTHGVE
jgi:hypothetical protein